jgi:hypothetical protein
MSLVLCMLGGLLLGYAIGVAKRKVSQRRFWRRLEEHDAMRHPATLCPGLLDPDRKETARPL